MLNRDGEVSEKRAVYDELGKELDSDSCWGFIGDDIDYMVKENVQPFVDRYMK